MKILVSVCKRTVCVTFLKVFLLVSQLSVTRTILKIDAAKNCDKSK